MRKPTGPLHPLPIPDGRGDSIVIDFIGPLPEDDGFNAIVTMTDCLSANFQAIPTCLIIIPLDYTPDSPLLITLECTLL